MNRFHVHLNVADLHSSVRFYSELFATKPSVLKPDYAKWMLDNPRINFAISNSGRAPGIDHLGIQVESEDDLTELGHRLDAAGGTVIPEDATVCCYAKSDKLWTEDPQGTRWETFHTISEATTYQGGEGACARGEAACSPDTRMVKPKVDKGSGRCTPQSGCC